MRVGIIGCGQLGWVHLSHITRFRLGEVAGICDFYRPQLEKTGSAFNVRNLYGDPQQLVAEAKPDVVHIVTPPPTHADLAIQALRAGCHVLVEKPMALSLEEADRMIAAARETGKSLCVDHNRLFSPPTIEARRLLEAGELGELVSVDFHQGYGLPTRLKFLLSDNQWLSRLPGGLVEDLAPHCLYSLLEFAGTPVRFNIVAKRTGLLPAAPAEEVRIVMEGERALGTGTISLSAQPFVNYFTLYGSKGTARVYLDNFTLTVRKDRFSHSLLNRLYGPVDEGRQMIFRTASSALQFATKRQPRYPDILELIRSFYRSIQNAEPSPVSPEQGREVIRLMGEVVEAMRRAKADQGARAPAVFTGSSERRPGVLVTGGTGLVGGALVRRLLSRGIRPRVLARTGMRVRSLCETGAEVITGDVSDPEAVARAIEGMEAAFHCAARMGSQGTWEDFHRDTVLGTENVLRASHRQGVRQLIYISSLGVYGLPHNGNCITEKSPYDPEPDKRGKYSKAKILAEQLALRRAEEDGIPLTVFRPGLIFGKGRPLPTAPLAFPSPFSSSYVVIGDSRSLLGVNYIENLVDALMLALDHPENAGRQFNIVDREDLTCGEYHSIRGQVDGTRAVFVPAFPFRMASPGIEIYASRSGNGKLATFSTYALRRALASVHYDVSAVREELGWNPRVSLQDALRASIS